MNYWIVSTKDSQLPLGGPFEGLLDARSWARRSLVLCEIAEGPDTVAEMCALLYPRLFKPIEAVSRDFSEIVAELPEGDR